MKEIVEARLKDLEQRSFTEILELPPHVSEKVKCGGRNITLTVWKDKTSENEVQVVVQAYKPWFLGLGKMNAQGFRINSSDELRSLRSEELYEFI